MGNPEWVGEKEPLTAVEFFSQIRKSLKSLRHLRKMRTFVAVKPHCREVDFRKRALGGASRKSFAKLLERVSILIINN